MTDDLVTIAITNDAATARALGAAGVARVMVDLERRGKAERQRGYPTLISDHRPDDISALTARPTGAEVMVRLDPVGDWTAAEMDDAIARGARRLMLPMVDSGATARAAVATARGRVPLVLLVETPAGVAAAAEIARVARDADAELYFGLTDLHIALRARFTFEPLAEGRLDEAAAACVAAGVPFGIGGVGRPGAGGPVDPALVLAECVGLGATRAILSRAFFAGAKAPAEGLVHGVAWVRDTVAALRRRDAAQVAADRAAFRAAVRGHVASIA